MSRIPIYRSVYLSLKQAIKDGDYPPGSLLPTEPELEERYHVSRTTIRKVISLLSNEGLVKAQQGLGTTVLNFSTTQKLNKITSITETLKKSGHEVTTKDMFIEKIDCPESILKKLQLQKGDFVYKIQRIQCSDGIPIAIMTNYLRESSVPNLDRYANTFVGLYNFLENKYGIILTEASETLSAISADFYDSHILNIPTGSPLLCSKRITYCGTTPFEFAIIKFVADKYQYSIYLKGR